MKAITNDNKKKKKVKSVKNGQRRNSFAKPKPTIMNRRTESLRSRKNKQR